VLLHRAPNGATISEGFAARNLLNKKGSPKNRRFYGEADWWNRLFPSGDENDPAVPPVDMEP